MGWGRGWGWGWGWGWGRGWRVCDGERGGVGRDGGDGDGHDEASIMKGVWVTIRAAGAGALTVWRSSWVAPIVAPPARETRRNVPLR